ncbi:hypothetical protein Pmani_009368 [Petrolisthes manimaculis]|uniref:Uncharacterized protein n=1 Tax=Petrolisthes manimaculis TaxID=1843537 RepID=A0AAE1Q4D2_9EUCA|nr:hypothetical protein Pmani_009368 [Petrolisthes manimaculis]
MCGVVTGILVAAPIITTTATAGTTSVSVGTGALLVGTVGVAAVGAATLGAVALASAVRNRGGRHRREVDNETLDEVFAVVGGVDTEGCGLRHVCYVFSKIPEELTHRERAIRRLIGEKPVPVSPKKIRNPSAAYLSAAILGDRGEDCVSIYKTCSLSYTQVHDYLTQLDSHQI